MSDSTRPRARSAPRDVVVEALGSTRPKFSVATRTWRLEERRLNAPGVARLHGLQGRHDRLDVVGGHPLEQLAGLLDLDQRTGRAQPEATHPLDDHVPQPGLGGALSQALRDLV